MKYEYEEYPDMEEIQGWDRKRGMSGRTRGMESKLDGIAALAGGLFQIVLDGDGESVWFVYDNQKDQFEFNGWSERHKANFCKEIRLKGKSLEECARDAFDSVLGFKPPRRDEWGDPIE